MISIEEVAAQNKDTGATPYVVPDDVQENPYKYGDPYDGMIDLLKQIQVNIDRIADLPEMMRTQPHEIQVNLSSVPYSTTIQMRTSLLVLTATLACTIGLQVGTGVQQNFVFASGDTKVLPYITNIGQGVDLALTTTAGVATGYLIAFPMG